MTVKKNQNIGKDGLTHPSHRHLPFSPFPMLTMTPAKNRQSTGKSRRGFASMDPDRQRAIASKGGKAAHAAGRAHEWTSKEAAEAGRKGGSR